MNELIDYFVNMGMTPEVAVQLASKVAVMTPPDPPIANGVKAVSASAPPDGPGSRSMAIPASSDALVNLLTTRYHMNPHQAFAYAGHVLSGTAPASKELEGEALTQVADREVGRLGAMKDQADHENRVNQYKLQLTAGGQIGHLQDIAAWDKASRIAPQERTPEQWEAFEAIDGPAKEGMRSKADQYIKQNLDSTKVYQDDQDAKELAKRDAELKNKGLTTTKGEE